MKLYLFGGCETDQGQAPTLIDLFNKVLAEIKPKQLLHIPYARIEVPKDEKEVWGEGWVSKKLNLNGIELLDARKEEDINRAKNPTILMNGGPQNDLLYSKIITNSQLHKLVLNAKYIIGESAGSMMCGEYYRTYKNNKMITTQGLEILKDTIITAHYTQRNRHQELKEVMRISGAQYGLGIDSLTAAVIETSKYPKYEVFGDEVVELIRKEDLD